MLIVPKLSGGAWEPIRGFSLLGAVFDIFHNKACVFQSSPHLARESPSYKFEGSCWLPQAGPDSAVDREGMGLTRFSSLSPGDPPFPFTDHQATSVPPGLGQER